MISITSFKSSSMKHYVHFVNFGPVWSEIHDKAGSALGRGNLEINKSLTSPEGAFPKKLKPATLRSFFKLYYYCKMFSNIFFFVIL